MIQERPMLPIGTIVQDAQREEYVVEGVLGKGGFSSIYLVREQLTHEHVFALKEIINSSFNQQLNLAFEAQVLKRLHHPSLPHIYQVFEDTARNRTYLLMDYIEGKDLEILRERQAHKRYPLVLVILLMTPIVDAINYLHAQNPPIVHRDIKPANIIVPIESSDAVLVDFGLAKEYVEDKTTNIFRYGTPGYAAPEQYGQGTSPRTDIYGLAATIYTLLTGIIPIDAMSRSFNKEASDPLQRADLLNPAIPVTVGKVLERALSLHAERRYATISAFWKDFNSAAEINAAGGTDAISTMPLPVTSSLPPSALTPNLALQAEQLPTSDEIQKQPERHQPPRYLRGAVVLVSLLLLLLSIGVGSLFWAGSSSHGTPSIPRPHNTPPVTITSHPTVSACAPPNTLVPGMAYPQISPCYGGTISDLGVAHGKEAMYLSAIKQTQGSFSGKFQGLGFIGTLKGSVSQTGAIQFIVSIPGRADTITFTGSIKYGGDLTGNFVALDKNGQASLDEYGFWYAQALHQ